MQRCFEADPAVEKPAYSMVIPPPNVTGILHLGHVLNNTIQDILARRARQKGCEVLWLPGTDQYRYCNADQGGTPVARRGRQTRRDIGRETFLEKVWDWKESTVASSSQLKRLGCSCDWES